MGDVIQVLRAVAKDLANEAKSRMPKLRDGEKICREWLENSMYCRETVLNGDIFLAQYNFKTKAVNCTTT